MNQVTAKVGEVVMPKDDGCWMIRYYDPKEQIWYMLTYDFSTKERAEYWVEKYYKCAKTRIVHIPGEGETHDD